MEGFKTGVKGDMVPISCQSPCDLKSGFHFKIEIFKLHKHQNYLKMDIIPERTPMLYAPLEDGLSQQVRLKTGEIALIRPLVGAADIAACEQLQKETWGDGPHAGLISHSVLGVIPSVGGLVVGGFVDDVLQACLISLPGFSKAAQPLQWSSRLAVTKGYRDSGLGYEMKCHQRMASRQMHVTDIYWTYGSS